MLGPGFGAFFSYQAGTLFGYFFKTFISVWLWYWVED
jgi:hypothetical protein